LLEAHHLTESIFDAINAHLAERGLFLREGTIVDATLIAAPPSTKNKEPARDTEMHQQAKHRVRYLNADQASILIRELPQHLADMVTFSLVTGLRRSNVTKLEWSQVDMQRNVAWIHGDQAKAGKPIHVTLNETAIAILTRQIEKHPRSVFSYKGKPVTQVNTKAWYKALKRAGIEDFRWHDLRHTWASWLTQNGVPLNVIQEMGAWESAEMVRRYAYLAPEQFSQHARVLDGVLNVTDLAQSK